MTQAGPAQVHPISLAGSWRFALDPLDAGLAERWSERTLSLRIRLPGALQNQGFGDDITVDTKWTGEVGTDRWKRGEQYEQYRQPGHIKVPFFLQPEKHYVGPAWYQRDIDLPKEWRGKRTVLVLERPHWETRVWLDGRLVGTNDSLSTPHVYDLGTEVAPGRHSLAVRIDNRVLVEVGDWSHSVSDHTQGNWNGVVGKIELRATSPVWIDDAQVYPDVARRMARVQVHLGNRTGRTGHGTLSLGSSHFPVEWSPQGGTYEREVSVGEGVRPWDEFDPALASMRVAISGEAAADERLVSFGLRKIGTTSDRLIAINGRPTFLRGTLECCIFPKTGYPPTDVESWKRIIRVCKDHGLNHVRFHSWCPPEAAFVAADELGFYYQIECGVWTQPGNGRRIDQWLYDESERIVRAYGNHPAFVLFTHGNEPHGPKREEYLAQWVTHWKRDGRFLVTSGSAYPQLPENQYHVHYVGRGPSGWLGQDYRQSYEPYTVPIVIHEMGQWCAYPNFDEIRKYTGPLRPKNFEIFRDSLAEHGMLEQRKDFLHASGRLQALCYKEECEAALRTPGVSGVQLLDLHDFPGQGTALVGVLDAFWEEKGYIKPEAFRRFYDRTVPLARLTKRVWTTDETLVCNVELAHFGAGPISNAMPFWRLTDARGRRVAGAEWPPRNIPVDRGIMLGQISTALTACSAPGAYKLIIGLKGTRFENDWDVWILPAKPDSPPPGDVQVTSALDAAALNRLAAGDRVVLATDKFSPAHPKLTFEPIFWNRYMFNTQHRHTLGLWCDARHPALARFPTSAWQDWLWSDVVTHARGVILDELPRGLRPIVQPIDDWNTNRKLGLVFECRVGPGRLLICAADLTTDLDKRPAARQLRESLLAYAASAKFKPRTQVAATDLIRVLDWAAESTVVNLGAKVIRVDSEDQAHGNVAANAIDGDPATFWHTRWQPQNDPMPHELVIDLGRQIRLTGITGLPRQDMANGRIAEIEVFCSPEDASWQSPVAVARWADTAQRQTVRFSGDVSGRYLRLLVKSEVNGQPFASLAELDVVPSAD